MPRSLTAAFFQRCSLRLSVVEVVEGMEERTIGHVTLGSRASGKELGHWTKVGPSPQPQLE